MKLKKLENLKKKLMIFFIIYLFMSIEVNTQFNKIKIDSKKPLNVR